MSPLRQKYLKNIGILSLAVLVMLWFPVAFAAVIISGKQLLYGFEDFPMILTMGSFFVGGLLSLSAFALVCLGVWEGKLRLPIILTACAGIFGLVSLPASRWMTQVEQETRDSRHGSNG